MTESNRSDCKYVEIFTHRVDSVGAPSRRTVLIRGTNTKVPITASRNKKTNIFQEGNEGFKATIDPYKQKCIKVKSNLHSLRK
jgi:hypothetical protein